MRCNALIAAICLPLSVGVPGVITRSASMELRGGGVSIFPGVSYRGNANSGNSGNVIGFGDFGNIIDINNSYNVITPGNSGNSGGFNGGGFNGGPPTALFFLAAPVVSVPVEAIKRTV